MQSFDHKINMKATLIPPLFFLIFFLLLLFLGFKFSHFSSQIKGLALFTSIKSLFNFHVAVVYSQSFLFGWGKVVYILFRVYQQGGIRLKSQPLS